MSHNHLKIPITLKDWQTGRNLTCSSGSDFARKYNIPIQVVCDIRNGRRKTYGRYSLPELLESEYYKCQFKNLKTGKIYKYRTQKEAIRRIGVGSKSLGNLIKKSDVRYKHFASIDFNDFDSIPKIAHNSNGKVTPIYHLPDFVGSSGTSEYRKFYFRLKQQRITGKKDFKVLGVKNYKYLILDRKTGKEYRVLTLKKFALDMGLKPQSLYHRHQRFEVIEG